MPHSPIRKALLLLLAVTIAVYGVFTYRSMRLKEQRRIHPKSIIVGYAASEKPDTIILTPSADMKTMATITWRTSEAIADGVVRFTKEDGGVPDALTDVLGWEERPARQTVLFSPELVADNTVHCHKAVLTGLSPGTAYRYQVGSRERDVWSEIGTFETEPENATTFSFAYFGDAQDSPELFGKLLKTVVKKHPEIAFVMIGGDFVEAGDIRNFWDDLLFRTENIFMRKPLVPAMGNHDFGNTDIGAKIFMAYFGMPASTSEAETPANYHFKYGMANFLVVNSLRFSAQTSWIEQELQKAREDGAAFTVAMFHYPLYRSREGQSGEKTRRIWEPLFDRYGVDLALTGHDHSYLRSKPLKGGKVVADGEFGTVHVTATACEKFYKTQKVNVAAKQLSNVASGQVITLGIEDGQKFMRYVAYDPEGEVIDEFESRRKETK